MAEIDIWWLLPLVISLLIGAICPTTGAMLVSQRRVLLANLMAIPSCQAWILRWPLALTQASAAWSADCSVRSLLNA